MSTHAEKSALSFDISHDVVALVVLEIFHKLRILPPRLLSILNLYIYFLLHICELNY